VRKSGKNRKLGGDADMKKQFVPSKLVTKLYSRIDAYGNLFLIAYAFFDIGFRV
jgi:hypothetical protein